LSDPMRSAADHLHDASIHLDLDQSEATATQHAQKSPHSFKSEETAKLDLIHLMNITRSPVSFARCSADSRTRTSKKKLDFVEGHYEVFNSLKPPTETPSPKATQDAQECCEAFSSKAAQSELLNLTTITRSPVSLSRFNTPPAVDHSSPAAPATYEPFHDIRGWMTMGSLGLALRSRRIWNPEPRVVPSCLHNNADTRSKCVFPTACRAVKEQEDCIHEAASCWQELDECRSVFTSTKSVLDVSPALASYQRCPSFPTSGKETHRNFNESVRSWLLGSTNV